MAAARRWPRRWLIAHAILMAPAWGVVGVLAAGWVAAHVFIGIKNPGGVQDGEHAVLDVLGAAAVFVLLPGAVSMVAVLVTLPWVLAGYGWRGWRVGLLALVLGAPAVLMLAMMIAGGSPRWLVDWMPD